MGKLMNLPAGQGGRLPHWLFAALVVAICLPFALVTVPPLLDMPGHMAASAIEAAPANSSLWRFYSWHWALIRTWAERCCCIC